MGRADDNRRRCRFTKAPYLVELLLPSGAKGIRMFSSNRLVIVLALSLDIGVKIASLLSCDQASLRASLGLLFLEASVFVLLGHITNECQAISTSSFVLVCLASPAAARSVLVLTA